MKTILILDALRGSAASSDLDDLLPVRSRILRSDRVPIGTKLDQIMVVDHGTLECLAVAREALAYRGQHQNCRVRVLRDVERDCSDAEALIRALAPRQDAQTMSVAAAALPQLVRTQGEFEARPYEGGVLFEYAA